MCRVGISQTQSSAISGCSGACFHFTRFRSSGRPRDGVRVRGKRRRGGGGGRRGAQVRPVSRAVRSSCFTKTFRQFGLCQRCPVCFIVVESISLSGQVLTKVTLQFHHANRAGRVNAEAELPADPGTRRAAHAQPALSGAGASTGCAAQPTRATTAQAPWATQTRCAATQTWCAATQTRCAATQTRCAATQTRCAAGV